MNIPVRIYALLTAVFFCLLVFYKITRDQDRRIAALESAAINNSGQIRQLQHYGDKVGACITNLQTVSDGHNRNEVLLQEQINECARGLANLILVSHSSIPGFTNFYRGPDGEEYWIRIDPKKL